MQESNINVLMIVRFFYPHLGGNENQAKLLSEYLSKIYNVNIVVLTSKYNKDLKSNEYCSDFNIIRLNHYIRKGNKYTFSDFLSKVYNKFTLLLEEYTFQYSIYKYLKRNIQNYDIIHVHQTSWLSILPSYLGKKSNKIVLIKEATLNGYEFLKYLYLPKRLKNLPINNSNFIGVSELIINNLLEQGVKQENLYYIPNGVELKTDVELSLQTKSNKKDYFEILFVGNFIQGPIKGLDVLIKAIGVVFKSNPNIQLNILGKGDKSIYSKMIEDLGIKNNILFLGSQNSYDYYKKSDIFVLPSRSEGMSNSLLEAMSLGLPCIATNVSGVSDIIDDGENGFIVEIEDYKDMADKIIQLIENEELLKKFKNNSIQKIKNKFSMEKIAEMYYKLYNSLIRNGN